MAPQEEHWRVSRDRLLDCLDCLEREDLANSSDPIAICVSMGQRPLELCGSCDLKDFYRIDDAKTQKKLFEDIRRMKLKLGSMKDCVTLFVRYENKKGSKGGPSYEKMEVRPYHGDQFDDYSTNPRPCSIVDTSIPEEVRSLITYHSDEAGTRQLALHKSPSSCSQMQLNPEQNRTGTLPWGDKSEPGSNAQDSCLRLHLSNVGVPVPRTPVEIEQTTDEEPRESSAADAERDDDLATPLLHNLEDTTNTAIWALRVHWQLLGFFNFLRHSFGRILLMTSATVVTYAVVKIIFASASSTNKQSNDGGRPTQVLDCARILSEGIGLSGQDRNRTCQWQAVEWFLHGGGMFIEVPSVCDWSSSFGIAYGLIVLRGSLGVLDRSWYSNVRAENPMEDICRWKRITCDGEETTIQRLNLGFANLTGTIPSELARFTDLNSLQLENNLLNGTIPSEMGYLTDLENLLVHRTHLTGTISTSLGRLTVLKQLLTDHTQLSGTMPSEICQLRQQNLKYLSSDCQARWDGKPFVRCNRQACCTYCG